MWTQHLRERANWGASREFWNRRRSIFHMILQVSRSAESVAHVKDRHIHKAGKPYRSKHHQEAMCEPKTFSNYQAPILIFSAIQAPGVLSSNSPQIHTQPTPRHQQRDMHATHEKRPDRFASSGGKTLSPLLNAGSQKGNVWTQYMRNVSKLRSSSSKFRGIYFLPLWGSHHKKISVSEWVSSRVCQIDFRQRFRAHYFSFPHGLTDKQGAQQSKI